MKRSLLALAVLALLGSCGKDLDDLLTIGVDVEIDRQTVPGLGLPACDLLVNVLPALMQPLTIDLRGEEELEGEGIIGEFESVVLENVILDIVDVPQGDTDNWDFVDSVRLYADDPDTPEPPVLVAELDPVPRGLMRMVIPGTGVDVADIASADNFTVSGEVTGRIPCDDVNFVGEANFEVSLF